MFAYQGGVKLDLPWLPFASLTAQYTKIEPFVYTHPPTWNSDTRLRVNTNYTNDGENLGYHLKPNSDELLLKLDTRLAADWRADFQYSFIRHGDNPIMSRRITSSMGTSTNTWTMASAGFLIT